MSSSENCGCFAWNSSSAASAHAQLVARLGALLLEELHGLLVAEGLEVLVLEALDQQVHRARRHLGIGVAQAHLDHVRVLDRAHAQVREEARRGHRLDGLPDGRIEREARVERLDAHLLDHRLHHLGAAQDLDLGVDQRLAAARHDLPAALADLGLVDVLAADLHEQQRGGLVERRGERGVDAHREQHGAEDRADQQPPAPERIEHPLQLERRASGADHTPARLERHRVCLPGQSSPLSAAHEGAAAVRQTPDRLGVSRARGRSGDGRVSHILRTPRLATDLVRRGVPGRSPRRRPWARRQRSGASRRSPRA